MMAIEFARPIDPQSPTVCISTFLPPKRVQNGPSLNATRSSSPRADWPQQSNAFHQARHDELVSMSVVAVDALKEMLLVCPCATTTCCPAAAQLRLSTVRMPTGQPRVFLNVTSVKFRGIGPLPPGLPTVSCSPGSG